MMTRERPSAFGTTKPLVNSSHLRLVCCGGGKELRCELPIHMPCRVGAPFCTTLTVSLVVWSCLNSAVAYDPSHPYVMYSSDLLMAMENNCSNCDSMLPHLNAALAAHSMQTPLRTAAFVSLVKHASDSFRYVRCFLPLRLLLHSP